MLQRLLLVMAAILVAVTPSALAVQSAEPWLPVTPQDLGIKSVPGNPGASAMQLYYSYYKDDNAKFISVYRRLKILTDAGRQFADGEIVLEQGQSLKEFRARTIHPDGSIVEFQGKPLEKTIAKAHGIKYTARAFVMPDVTAGSIVECSYLITLRPHLVDAMSQWTLQWDLYTLKERFRFAPTRGYVDVPSEWSTAFRMSQSMCSYSNKPGSPPLHKEPDGRVELNLNDVAAFESEENMPPKSDYQPSLTCYYGGHEFVSADSFWPVWQKRISDFTEKWIGKPAAVRDAAAQAIGTETRPEEKLRKLYARAQQIRNLSYEPQRTQKEEERLKLKPNAEAKEVLQHGYGTHWEIDALFVDLARAAGFDATMLGISNRYERSFSKMVLWLGQLDGVAVLVRLDGKEVVLDPGTRFCPYGVLPWKYTAADALDYKSGGSFTTTPDPENSPTRRVVRIALAPDGSAKGEISVELNVQESLQHRLEALQTDEAGRRKSFESEVQAWLPTGAVAKLEDSQGWDSSDGPLTARFTFDLPNFASLTGKRMLVPAYFLLTPFKSMFTPASRSYPMNFPFGLTERDQVTIQLPDHYTLEAPPSQRKAGLSYASYEISSTLQENQLVISRSIRLDGLSFPPERYQELRNFFTVVHGGDASQAVLQAEATKSAAEQK
jgi:hypothetical protein